MNQINANLLNSELELKLCIQRTFVESAEFVKKTLQIQSALIMKKYQLDLTYEQQHLGCDLQLLFFKINAYSQCIQNLLCQYGPCRKLGQLLKIINQCLANIFQFFKTNLHKKKNYTQQRLKFLQKQFQTQTPEHCNRCNSFILSRNIEQTKVLLGVGQFSDPFNLYLNGGSDFLNKRNIEQDIQYKLKYVNVWQNKMKIEQKFHLMQVQFDKRTYAHNYSINQIQKIQEVISNIIQQIKPHQISNFSNQFQFYKHIRILISKIYQKLHHKKQSLLNNQGVQTDQGQNILNQENIKKINDKLLKKNSQIQKKLVTREKQITEMISKIDKLTQQISLLKHSKNQFEVTIHNWIQKNVLTENILQNAKLQIRGYNRKLEDIEKQNQNLRTQIKKRQDQIKVITQKKNNKGTEFSKQSQKQFVNEVLDNMVSQNNTNSYSFQQKNKRVSKRHSLKKSVNIDQSQDKGKADWNQQNKIQENYYQSTKKFLSKSKINQLLQNQQKDLIDQVINLSDQNRNGSEILIKPNQSYKEREQKFVQNGSTKKIKNKAKSLRKIKRKSSIKEEIIDKRVENVIQQNIKNNLSKQPINNNNINENLKGKTKFVKNKQNHKKATTVNILAKQDNLPINSAQQKNNQRLKPIKYQSQHVKNSINKKQYPIIKRSDSKYSFHNSISKNDQTKSFINKTFQQTTQQQTILPFIKKISNLNIQNCLKFSEQSNQKLQAFRAIYKLYITNIENLKLFQSLKQNKKQIMQLQKNKLTFQQFYQAVYNFISFTLLFSDQLRNSAKINDLQQSAGFSSKEFQKIKKNYTKQLNQKNENYFISQKVQKSGFNQNNNKLQKSLNTNSFYKKQNIQKTLSIFHQTNLSQIISTQQLKNIKQRLLKLYIRPQYALQVQNTHSSFLKTTHNSTINCSLNSTFSTLPQPNMLLDYNSLSHQILSKYQLNYFKTVTILFAKMHQENYQIYQIIKKSMIHPYTQLSGESFIVPGQGMVKSKQREERSTVGGYENRNFKQISLQPRNMKLSILFSDAIIKFILLHRRCHHFKTNSVSTLKREKIPLKSLVPSSNTTQNSTPMQNSTLLTPKCSQDKEKDENICKHLIQFKIQLSTQFGSRTVENKQNLKKQQLC